MVNRTTVIDSLGAISNVDGSPVSDSPNDEEFADNDKDDYENNNMEDERVPLVGQ